MNEKLKKVLTYTALGLIGGLFAIGSLVDVSKCSYQSNVQLETTNYLSNNRKMISYNDNSYSITFTANELNNYVWENFNDSLGDYYISLFSSILGATNNYNTSYDLDDTDQLSEGYFFIQLYSSDDDSMIRFNENEDYKFTYYVESVNQPFDINLTINFSSASYADFKYGITYDVENNEAITPEEPEEIVYNTFVFEEQFNYNAFLQREPFNLQNLVIQSRAPFVTYDGDVNVIAVTYTMPKFKSGGMVFDTIYVYYGSALGASAMNFEWNGEVVTSSGNYNKWFYYMEYKNSSTYGSLRVCQRDFYKNNTITTVKQEVSWLGQSYQTLEFIEPLPSSSYQYNLLLMVNNIYSGGGFIPEGNNSYLSDVFALLGLGFSSMVPFLTMQIMPGITLGILIFMPLITGIIIFIIWLVKR